MLRALCAEYDAAVHAPAHTHHITQLYLYTVCTGTSFVLDHMRTLYHSSESWEFCTKTMDVYGMFFFWEIRKKSPEARRTFDFLGESRGNWEGWPVSTILQWCSISLPIQPVTQLDPLCRSYQWSLSIAFKFDSYGCSDLPQLSGLLYL